MNYKFVSWGRHEAICYSIIDKMVSDGYKPDCIIGLLRGGVIPARIFSDYFDIILDFYAIDVKSTNGVNKYMSEAVVREFNIKNFHCKNILVIDDIWDTGKTMNAILKELKGEKVTTATLYWKNFAVGRPSYYEMTEESNEWIYTKEDALKNLFIEEDEFDSIIYRIKSKKNIIIQGPPGVGKTYVAKRLAFYLMGCRDDCRIAMIQFHQSYSYEDFIQGFRPNEDGKFLLKNGIFYEFCEVSS